MFGATHADEVPLDGSPRPTNQAPSRGRRNLGFNFSGTWAGSLDGDRARPPNRRSAAATGIAGATGGSRTRCSAARSPANVGRAYCRDGPGRHAVSAAALSPLTLRGTDHAPRFRRQRAAIRRRTGDLSPGRCGRCAARFARNRVVDALAQLVVGDRADRDRELWLDRDAYPSANPFG